MKRQKVKKTGIFKYKDQKESDVRAVSHSCDVFVTDTGHGHTDHHILGLGRTMNIIIFDIMSYSNVALNGFCSWFVLLVALN